MQAPPSGGGEPARSGLARFHSAPAPWLEALLEDEEEDPLKQNHFFTQLLAGAVNPPPPTIPSRTSSDLSAASPSYGAGAASGHFLRQNSSPADFLGSSSMDESDVYFSNYGVPGDIDFVSPDMGVSPSGKRGRGLQSAQQLSGDYNPHNLTTEQQDGGQTRGGGGGGGVDAACMEKLLEDSVSFRVRAKRGCATHPRSIAERVRRTRISDRIRKLQELVPNMDKQTNTADMLDEAVEYVKFLQKQIQNCLFTLPLVRLPLTTKSYLSFRRTVDALRESKLDGGTTAAGTATCGGSSAAPRHHLLLHEPAVSLLGLTNISSYIGPLLPRYKLVSYKSE
ncbi:hypothetical protein CRG98_017241 [Punica granatum]|uniref:BHLH domain-containing protein n=1 Tax=Punica granatum TaxID=22663 RepID=A0A2I0K1J9_PUNGR|nr:hypothetical protein CRG98_017241 [Punica granatum]